MFSIGKTKNPDVILNEFRCITSEMSEQERQYIRHALDIHSAYTISHFRKLG